MLEEVNRTGSKITARCPACAEDGHDRKGNHLFIGEDGKFGCVVYPGDDGENHRRRIYALAGVTGTPQEGFKIKTIPDYERKVIKKDILGRLGHIQSTLTRKKNDQSINKNNNNGCDNNAPSVPKVNLKSLTHEKMMMLDESYRKIFE